MVANSLPLKKPRGIEIDVQPSTLDAYVASHIGTCERPLGIVQITAHEQLPLLIEWAAKHQVPLVPVSSRGPGRRRGDTALSVPALVVDFSALRKVIHVDAGDEIAVIEPGVDFRTFDEALKKQGLRSIKPLLPRPGKSVIATYLEREPSIGPNIHWDTTDPLAALSIVFGSGDTFRTGGASIPGTLEENLQRGNRQMMASGPLVTDYGRVLLGSQGTLGMVSWASIYCETIPVMETPYLYCADELGVLTAFARQLCLQQLGMHFFILSATQLAAVMAEDGAEYAALQGTAADCKWYLYVNLVADAYLPEQRMAWQHEALVTLAEQVGARLVTDACLSATRLAQYLQQGGERYYKDVPTGQHTEVFCLSQLTKVSALIDLAEKALAACADHSAAPLTLATYIQPTIQGVSCHVEFTLLHDAADRQLATKFASDLVTLLAANGGFFSRPYGDWAQVAYGRDANIVPYLRSVKKLFDPAGILNPGKLCF